MHYLYQRNINFTNTQHAHPHTLTLTSILNLEFDRNFLYLEFDLPPAFMLLDRLARHVNAHVAPHLHRHLLLKNRQIDFPANPGIATDIDQTREDVRAKIRLQQDPIRHDLHRRVDRHRPTPPRPPRRLARLSDHHATVEERGRHVSVLDRREIRIPHPDVGDQSHVAAADELETAGGEVSDSHGRTSESEHGRS